MHLRLPAAFGAVVLSGALVATARAESASALAAKLARAAADIRSFVVEIHVPGTMGASGTLTFVRPMRVKSDLVVDGLTVETYLIDQTVYIHSPYAGWQKTAADELHAAPQSMDIAQTLGSAHLTILADRDENGRRLGAFAADIAPPVPAGTKPAAGAAPSPTPSSPAAPPKTTPADLSHLECTYDKATYRLAACSTSAMTLTYEKYNDPGNAVELPADAARAVPVVVPSSPPADATAGSPPPQPPEAPSPTAQPATPPGTPQRSAPPQR